MTQSKHPHPQTHAAALTGVDNPGQPYWKRAHHDWKFRVAVVLMLVGMAIYIATLDLSTAPVGVQPPAQPGQMVP
jgi:hypothetical protein